MNLRPSLQHAPMGRLGDEVAGMQGGVLLNWVWRVKEITWMIRTRIQIHLSRFSQVEKRNEFFFL